MLATIIDTGPFWLTLAVLYPLWVFAFLVVMLRWVLRINKIVEVSIDQASFLEDIKEIMEEEKALLQKIAEGQEKLLAKSPVVIKQVKKENPDG